MVRAVRAQGRARLQARSHDVSRVDVAYERGLPPTLVLPGARLRELGRGADKQVARRQDGTAAQERDHRFMGANSITLRREMQRRGIEDPRFVTVDRAGWINRENNVSAAVLKPGAQPIELVSNPSRGDHAVALKHQQEELGYTERGKAGGQVMRAKDSDVCQGRTKTRPEWRRKIRPSGRPVACLKVAVRVG